MDAKWGENFKKEINTKVNIEAEGRGVILVKKFIMSQALTVVLQVVSYFGAL